MEKEKYARLWNLPAFMSLGEEEIKSSGYVVDTLEAAIWCFLNTNNYKDCVLKAVNLGEDTDTVGAVAGGLAGLYYGMEAIPKEWIGILSKKEWIMELIEKQWEKRQKGIHKKEGDDYRVSASFAEMLQNKDFYNILEELIDFGISRYKENFSMKYQVTIV